MVADSAPPSAPSAPAPSASGPSASGPPDEAALYQAALAHLARYATTAAGLRRVLRRRIERWVRAQPEPGAVDAGPAMAAAETVLARLARAGALDDAAFAETRARSLMRGGRSAQSITTRLVAKGVAPALARQAAAAGAEDELAAALVVVRRRRLGAFRMGAGDPARHAKEHARALGILARAGFSRETAERALATPAEEAEARIHALRQ